MNHQVFYGQGLLPEGVRSRMVDNQNGCMLHVLEAGYDQPAKPCVLLLHGFPELAFSWRKQFETLAAAGFHVVAPDHRGYGRSSGSDATYADDPVVYSKLNHVSDMLGLVQALGRQHVACVVGHDYGAQVAGWCALTRPDVFQSMVLLAAPFAGPPKLATAAPGGGSRDPRLAAVQGLAQLTRPRQHYQWYYAGPRANEEIWHCGQGVHDFLRAYFHCKSGDWEGNQPQPLAGWSAEELARMPTYYVMEAGVDMARTVAPYMPSASQVANCTWLSEEELSVYSGEFRRNGFQAGLQGYRVATDPRYLGDLRVFAGRLVDVPSMFIAGDRDWCMHQSPGLLQQMKSVCTRLDGLHLVEGAGHWVQQEAAEQVNALLQRFLHESLETR